MKRLLLRLLIFSAPFAAYALTVLIADPFDRFHRGGPVPEKIKLETSALLQPALWKLADFQREPKPNILLGDSRMDSLDAAAVSDLTGAEYANLAMIGSSLDEIISTFWFADREVELEAVTIGLNLNVYNVTRRQDRVQQAERLLEHAGLYLVDWVVARALYYNLSSALFGVEHRLGRPPMGPEQFWDYQLERAGDAMYARYSHPGSQYGKLAEIASYCRAKKIDLRFVIFPEHEEMQQRVARYGLETAERRFRADLRSLAPVLDFNSRGTLTADRGNYKDPIHFNDAVRDWIQCVTFTDGSGMDVRPAGPPGASSKTVAARICSAVTRFDASIPVREAPEFARPRQRPAFASSSLPERRLPGRDGFPSTAGSR